MDLLEFEGSGTVMTYCKNGQGPVEINISYL